MEQTSIIEKRHQENIERFDEMKHILADGQKNFDAHLLEDKAFQTEIRQQFDRMEPMIRAFENRRIVKMAFDTETSTLYIYAKRFVTIGGAVALLWAAIKYFLLK